MDEADRVRLHAVLVRAGLLDGPLDALPPCEAITGGVSSGIHRVGLATGPVVVKWALPTLRVAEHWAAPVTRNGFEVAYLERARAVVADAVPRVLAADPDDGAFVMEDLGHLPVWKHELRDGRADPEVAAALGSVVGRLHAATADDPEAALAFPTDDLFHDLRIEPYLLATARAVPAVADRLGDLAARLGAAPARVLVHGDVSPKNVLVRPDGAPVLLDAECAWFGEPAFDLAFVVNHLLLKGAWRPDHVPAYRACADALVAAYLGEVTWDAPEQVEARAAALLPALLLARVRGRSPVEYLDPSTQARIERFAVDLLLGEIGEDRPDDDGAPTGIAAVCNRWARFLDGGA